MPRELPARSLRLKRPVAHDIVGGKRMFGFEYPKKMPVGRVCLEVSLKPFGLDMSDAGIENTCRELFDGWRELIGHANGVSVLMWTSDGSEILEYTGDIESTFDWARYIGIGNPKKELPDWDPKGEDLHTRPVLYMDNPPTMRYLDLKRIISTIKRVGQEELGLDVEVGETFDPGPEFAYSDFKFHRHPELNLGSMMANLWIHCAGQLKGDTYRYAAYPDGIPEGTYFGRFLGEQFMALKRDVGFDYIWLSNGFGFSLQSWSWKGELFDGEKFDDSGAAAVRENIRIFWREFTKATGNMRIETRGSNLSAGMDISAHGCPVDDIYRYPMVVAPPNSPWAALDFRFGLELAGFMSRIARLPEKGYLFRYYTHDPWWHNSPWFDRYDRTPHDILLPLTVARMDEHGNVTPPMGISFLSADDSYGDLPRRCPVETTPFILDAYSHYPDEPGLVTWLYPFESYVRMGLYDGRMNEMFLDDWLIENAIDQGLPLNSVVADDIFLKADVAPYLGKVLVTPVPHAGSVAEAALMKALKAGCRVLMYGNTAYASDAVRNLLGVSTAPEISGELTIETSIMQDFAPDCPLPRKLRHVALVSNGGIVETEVAGAPAEYLAHVSDGANRRVYASLNRNALGGVLAWMRGSFPHDEKKPGALPAQLNKREFFPVGAMMRAMLEPLGVCIRFQAEMRDTNLPVIHNSMNDNAFYITGFAKDTTVRATLQYPDGAPLMEGMECILEDNMATYVTSKCWHKRCRLFALQKDRSVISVMRRTAEHPSIDERFLITGLKDATLVLRPPLGARVRFVDGKDGRMVAKTNMPIVWSEDGKTVRAEHVTGDVFVAWQSDHNPGSLLRKDQLHPIKVMETRR